MIRLEFERKRASLTQTALARAAALNRVTVNQIETGRVNPTDRELELIAEVLGFTEDPQLLMSEIKLTEVYA